LKDQSPDDGRRHLLAKGQELLLAKRKALLLARERSDNSPLFSDPRHPPYPDQKSITRYQLPVLDQQLITAIAELPEHLGWGSAAQTAVLRAAARRHIHTQQQDNHDHSWGWARFRETRSSTGAVSRLSSAGTVSLAPSVGLAILREKKAPIARLWLLLRAIDKDGRGAITLDFAREAFTSQDSPLCFCGRRQLRNLLAAGAGTFWQFDEKRIWLRSTVRVAQTLGVTRLRGGDVAIPLPALTGGIAAVRANLYAAFHSGRATKPISRQTLARKSGVSPRTLRHYDQLSGVEKKNNYARGPKLGSKEAEDLAWQQGPASFVWRESQTGGNKKESRFLAWQLPNSYHGPHARLGRGRQKRQNKALADLLKKGTAGNSHSQKDDLNPRSDDIEPRYFADASAASRAFGRNETAVYWPDVKPSLWHCFWPQTNLAHMNHSSAVKGG
jgi:hypothetical protein